RIANRTHPFADTKTVRVPERSLGQSSVSRHLQQRDIDRGIRPNDLAPKRPAVRHGHRDALGAGNHVMVRENVALAVDQKSASRSLTGAFIAARIEIVAAAPLP